MEEVKRTRIDEDFLDRLLGLDSSKIGFYSEVKQKIQELEAANLSLRIKKSELQAIFDSISDGVAIYNPKGQVQQRNHVCPRLFPQETMVGKSCRELFHRDRGHHPEYCPVERALRGECTQLSITWTRDGSETRYFDITATPIEDPSEQPRALLFLRDVTHRRVQELQLLQAEKMSSIGVLAAGVAHEINNPLTSVAGYAEALTRRLRDEPGLAGDPRLEVFSQYLETIIRESYRCKAIINNLLSFSRKSDGAFGRVDLNRILQEILELVRHGARSESVEIQDELNPELPPVNGDPSSLRQVFMNLTMNAIQAIDGAGVVKISTHQQGSKVTVEVQDTGKGIPLDVIGQIWEPFFTTKTVGQGLGLGLALSYNIVQKHQGEIQVESRPGQGSTFTVRLPAFQEN